MSTTTITSNERREIYDHVNEGLSARERALRTSADQQDRMIDYVIAESREQRAREQRREERRAQIRRRRTRGAVATGTVAIVIAVGGALFIIDGPSHGPGPASATQAPAAVIQPSSGDSDAHAAIPTTPAIATTTPAMAPTSPPATVPAANITPSTPAPGPSGNNTGNMGTGPNTQIPSGNNTGNMGSGGGPLSGSVSQ